MTINRKYLLQLLREVNDSPEIGVKEFESRFGLEEVALDRFGHVATVEKRPELRERDRYLIYARNQRLMSFEVKNYESREDFFGGPVSLTPEGVMFLEKYSQSWWKKQIKALSNNVVTILVSVLATLLAAYLLEIFGLS